ncbi:hypothetical protein Tco_0490753 [Tanacetum coccineum]
MIEEESMALVPVGEWLKFNNRNFFLDSQKEFRKRFSKIRIKEIECPEGLDFEEFGALHKGTAFQNLDYFAFRDHIEALDEADTMVFQLGGERRSITMIQFIQALRLHSRKEKVTLDELFLLHSMDGGVSVDVPWHVAKFLCNKAKGSKRKSLIVGAHLIRKIASYYRLMTLGSLMNVTLGPETSFMSVAKLVNLDICRYNGLGIGEMVVEIPEVARDNDVGAGQAKIGGLLAHRHIDHTCYDGTHYSYVLNIPDLGVQQGLNFMSGTPGYSTAPSPSASQFGMFGDAHPSISRNQDNMNKN